MGRAQEAWGAICEARLLALLLMVRRYQGGDEGERGEMFEIYLSHTAFINNWDLVDLSAPYLLGPNLEKRNRRILYRLARSECLWERRIAILSTLHFIRGGEFEDALALCEVLLHDGHDLIHKAVGWMLREIGKRNAAVEEAFLVAHYPSMPRTALRYAIERFPEDRRQAYLRGAI